MGPTVSVSPSGINWMTGLVMNPTLISFPFPFGPKLIIKLWCFFTSSHPRSTPPSTSDAFVDFLSGLFISEFSTVDFSNAFNLLAYGVPPFGDHGLRLGVRDGIRLCNLCVSTGSTLYDEKPGVSKPISVAGFRGILSSDYFPAAAASRRTHVLGGERDTVENGF